MIEYFVPLLSKFLPMWDYVLVFVFAGSILSFIGVFIHSLLRR